MDSYRLPSDESERTQLTWRIAADGYQFLEAALAAGAPAWLPQVPAVGILRTVWLQQFQRTITDGVQEVAWRGKDELPPSRARITSPYDPDSRNAVKRGSAWDGYKVHFTETCDAKETGRPHLITHVVTTDATVGDPVVVDEIHDQLDAKGLLPGEHLMDAGYISAELLLTAPSQRGVRVIGPVRPMTRRTVQATGYDKASFRIDWDARRAICPAGAHSRYWTEGLDNNQRSAIRIRFATETCAPCPSRGQCTNSTQLRSTAHRPATGSRRRPRTCSSRADH